MPITLTRAFLAILIPGGVFLASWVLLFLIKIDTSQNSIYVEYATPIHAVMLACIVIAGSFIEGISTHLEVKWDNEREAELQVTENWYKYLCESSSDCVAQQYIARMVTTMYFELGMMWASLSFGLGLSAIICTLKPSCFELWSVIAIGASVAALFYFKWQAKASHKVLCKVRMELNSRSGNKPRAGNLESPIHKG